VPIECTAAHYERGAPEAKLTAHLLYFPSSVVAVEGDEGLIEAVKQARLGCEGIVKASEAIDGVAGGSATGNDGLIAVLDRGGCAFGAKAMQAQQAGYAALVIIDNAAAAGTEEVPIAPPGLGDANVTIPVVMVRRTIGDALRAASSRASAGSGAGGKGGVVGVPRMALLFELESPIQEDASKTRRYVYQDVLAKSPLALLPGMVADTPEANDFRRKHYSYSQQILDTFEAHAAMRETEAVDVVEGVQLGHVAGSGAGEGVGKADGVEGSGAGEGVGKADGASGASGLEQSSRDQRSIADVKVAVYVFYGRKASFSITNIYLQRNLRKNGGIIDSVLFCPNTNVPEDLEYLQTLLVENPGVYASTDHEYDDAFKKGRLYGRFYTLMSDPDTVYVKLDDDIVYIKVRLEDAGEHMRCIGCMPWGLLPLPRCWLPLPRCLLPLPRCWLPLPRCLLPLPRCLLPLPRCLLPLPRCLLPLLGIVCSLLNDRTIVAYSSNHSCLFI
jgi:hypothetical protein